MAGGVLTEPAFILPNSLRMEARTIIDLLQGFARESSSLHDQTIAASAECYVRQLVASSATRIVMPATPRTYRIAPERLRQVLPPTFQRRVEFVDTNARMWRTVAAYFAPFAEWRKSHEAKRHKHVAHYLDRMVWGLYLLLLAHKRGSELAHSIIGLKKACEVVGEWPLPSEARARLAVMSGLFATYDQVVELPALTITATSDVAFADRVDDIFEDAHFLKVSALRKFFGVAQNRHAVVRDMKRLIAFITSRKRWAQNAIGVGVDLALLPRDLSAAAGKLAEIVESRRSPAPLCTTRYAYNIPEALHISASRGLEGWRLSGGLPEMAGGGSR